MPGERSRVSGAWPGGTEDTGRAQRAVGGACLTQTPTPHPFWVWPFLQVDPSYTKESKHRLDTQAAKAAFEQWFAICQALFPPILPFGPEHCPHCGSVQGPV